MGGIKVVMEQKVVDDCLIFTLPANPYKTEVINLLTKCNEKSSGFVSVTLEKPYKPRTTGEGSQNNLFWKLVQIISNETGEDAKEIEREIKEKAISKGYPYSISKITGKPICESMTRINTVQMSYLIDTCYEVIAFLGIELPPECVKEARSDFSQSVAPEEVAEKYGGGLF